MTTAIHSKSTTIKKGINTVGEVTNIGGLSMDTDFVDVTTLASLDGFKEFIPGFKDSGELPISGNMDPADTNGQAAMLADYYAGTLGSYTVTFPSAMGATWTFEGYVKSFKAGEADTGNALKFEAVIRITGKSTLNVTASGGLTALTLTGVTGVLAPAFSAALRSYTFTGVTAATFTVTPTAASHTIKLYVDGVFVENVTSGSASSAISLTTGISKLVTLVVNEVGKTEITYNIIVD